MNLPKTEVIGQVIMRAIKSDQENLDKVMDKVEDELFSKPQSNVARFASGLQLDDEDNDVK